MTIKVGDKMVFDNDIVTVTRLTKTMFICDNNMRFRKNNLTNVSVDKWNKGGYRCRVATPELISKINHNNEVKKIASYFKDNVNLDSLTKNEISTLKEIIKKIYRNR